MSRPDVVSLPALTVRVPPRRLDALRWVCDWLLGTRLGLAYTLQTHDSPLVEVQCGTGRVAWADDFFARTDAHWLAPGSARDVVPRFWPAPDAELQARLGLADLALLFGDGVYRQEAGLLRLPIDITGSCFFMLSRYEEAMVGGPRDDHGRSVGSSSVAGRAGLLLRPLVDEWVELLWWALQQVAPGLQRRSAAPRVWVTCDVDLPYSPGVASPRRALRQAAAHLVKEHQPGQALLALLNPLATRLGNTALDGYDRFDWMMDVNEAVGQRISFFFICARDATAYEGFYRVEEPRIARLIDRIQRRGHEVGLHATYASADEPALLLAELDRLRSVAGPPAPATPLGNRQHYLRWQADTTPAVLNAAGLGYDSTLGYADLPGFRCGTCHEFPLFDLKAGRALGLVERPLVLMEGSVLAPAYMNLGLTDAARQLMLGLKQTCRRFQGCFTLLWHNDGLRSPAARQLYTQLIQPYGC